MAKTLVLGGGLAGLNAALSARMKGNEVLLLDRDKFHEFVPGNVQLLGRRINEDELKIDIKKFLKGTGIVFNEETVERIKPEKSEVITNDNVYEYDRLIVALGSEIDEQGFDFSNVEDVYSISNTLHLREKIEESSKITVIGAGYVGLEVAGELADMGLDVTVVSKSEKPISHTNESASQIALRLMDEKNINFKKNKVISDISETKIGFKDGESFETDIMVWCAGLKASEAVRKSFNQNDEPKFESSASKYDDLKFIGHVKPNWRINSQDAITVGDTAIFFTRDKAYESRKFRLIEDLVRYKYFKKLKFNRFKAKTRNIISKKLTYLHS